MVEHIKATGVELSRIVDSMEQVLVGEQEEHVMMACLAVAISIQKQDVTKDQLQEGIRLTSEFISMWLSSLNQPIDPKKVN